MLTIFDQRSLVIMLSVAHRLVRARNKAQMLGDAVEQADELIALSRGQPLAQPSLVTGGDLESPPEQGS